HGRVPGRALRRPGGGAARRGAGPVARGSACGGQRIPRRALEGTPASTRRRRTCPGRALPVHLLRDLRPAAGQGAGAALALTADVVVVGGGMAGACAALAAREKGAEVLLVARASGATALSSGAIDFGGAADDATVGDGARALSRQPGHPYALLGDSLSALLERTLTFLRRHLVSLGLEGARVAADRCLWLPTPIGKARPAALAQSSFAAADLRNIYSRRV